MAIWNWVQQNASLLTAFGNLLLVFIWAIYLQLFYYQYRRQQKAELIIHQAQGTDASSSCLLVNMSQEVVHIECVIARIESEDGIRSHQVTDYHRVSANDPRAEQHLRQGPLRPGDYLLLGRFEEILREPPANRCETDLDGDRLPDEERLPDGERLNVQQGSTATEERQRLELRTVAMHGPSKYPVGVRRRFVVEQHADQTRIRPERLHTEHLLSRRDRAEVQQWLRECLHPSISD